MKKAKLKYKLDPDAINDSVFTLHEYSVNPASREVFLHGIFDTQGDDEEEPGVDYRMAAMMIRNIALLDEQGRGNVLIHQCTIGGDWNYGLAIYDAIKMCQSPTTLIAYAHARSMSSITIQAADRRVLTPNSEFMIHYGDFGVLDTSIGALTEADWAKKCNSRMLEIYAERCKVGPLFKGMTKGEIKNFIDKKIHEHIHWYLTPKMAVEYGFVDGVFGTKGFETMDKIRRK